MENDKTSSLKSPTLDIYNYNPAYKNLYRVEIYMQNTKGDLVSEKWDSGYNDMLHLENMMSFHATSVEFQGETLLLERNDITKKFKLSENPYTRSDKLTINIREDDLWTVKRAHEEWIKLFYDRETDTFQSADYSSNSNSVTGRYRTIRIFLPHHTDNDYDWNTCIQFNNVIPESVPGMELSWGRGTDIVSHSLSYYVESWEWSSREDTRFIKDAKLSKENMIEAITNRGRI